MAFQNTLSLNAHPTTGCFSNFSSKIIHTKSDVVLEQIGCLKYDPREPSEPIIGLKNAGFYYPFLISYSSDAHAKFEGINITTIALKPFEISEAVTFLADDFSARKANKYIWIKPASLSIKYDSLKHYLCVINLLKKALQETSCFYGSKVYAFNSPPIVFHEISFPEFSSSHSAVSTSQKIVKGIDILKSFFKRKNSISDLSIPQLNMLHGHFKLKDMGYSNEESALSKIAYSYASSGAEVERAITSKQQQLAGFAKDYVQKNFYCRSLDEVKVFFNEANKKKSGLTLEKIVANILKLNYYDPSLQLCEKNYKDKLNFLYQNLFKDLDFNAILQRSFEKEVSSLFLDFKHFRNELYIGLIKVTNPYLIDFEMPDLDSAKTI